MKGKYKQVSGYILYSAECRKVVQEENADYTFGEISKIVGTKVCMSMGYTFDVVNCWCCWSYMTQLNNSKLVQFIKLLCKKMKFLCRFYIKLCCVFPRMPCGALLVLPKLQVYFEFGTRDKCWCWSYFVSC